jgi:hypothetical protein
MGETIFKGHRSYDLMLELQLGIRYTITTLNKAPPPELIEDAHFEEKVCVCKSFLTFVCFSDVCVCMYAVRARTHVCMFLCVWRMAEGMG